MDERADDGTSSALNPCAKLVNGDTDEAAGFRVVGHPDMGRLNSLSQSSSTYSVMNNADSCSQLAAVASLSRTGSEASLFGHTFSEPNIHFLSGAGNAAISASCGNIAQEHVEFEKRMKALQELYHQEYSNLVMNFQQAHVQLAAQHYQYSQQLVQDFLEKQQHQMVENATAPSARFDASSILLKPGLMAPAVQPSQIEPVQSAITERIDALSTAFAEAKFGSAQSLDSSPILSRMGTTGVVDEASGATCGSQDTPATLSRTVSAETKERLKAMIYSKQRLKGTPESSGDNNEVTNCSNADTSLEAGVRPDVTDNGYSSDSVCELRKASSEPNLKMKSLIALRTKLLNRASPLQGVGMSISGGGNGGPSPPKRWSDRRSQGGVGSCESKSTRREDSDSSDLASATGLLLNAHREHQQLLGDLSVRNDPVWPAAVPLYASPSDPSLNQQTAQFPVIQNGIPGLAYYASNPLFNSIPNLVHPPPSTVSAGMGGIPVGFMPPGIVTPMPVLSINPAQVAGLDLSSLLQLSGLNSISQEEMTALLLESQRKTLNTGSLPDVTNGGLADVPGMENSMDAALAVLKASAAANALANSMDSSGNCNNDKSKLLKLQLRDILLRRKSLVKEETEEEVAVEDTMAAACNNTGEGEKLSKKHQLFEQM